MKETREGAEKLLAVHEREQERVAEEYERRRQLYRQGLIARNEVLQAEQALDQTATHDRLNFDHHNPMDVAVHPDSKEGHVLLAYLRQAGISFIGFRSAVPGAATGAHIHIGKPSPRSYVAQSQ